MGPFLGPPPKRPKNGFLGLTQDPSLFPRNPDWEKHFDDETGEYYYHNTVTGKSTWVEPKSLHFEPRGPVSPSGKKKRPALWDDEGEACVGEDERLADARREQMLGALFSEPSLDDD